MIDFRLLRHLWLFLAVAEEQHFGRAAKRLGMAQPPLTAQIKTLEHVLKVTLFERSRRGTKLTPAGTAMVPVIRKLVEQLERTELAIREIAAGQRSVLTIGAITAAMGADIPQLITQLKARHPDVTVSVKEIDSVEAIPLLQSGDIDLAFARLEGSFGKGIEVIPLKADRLALAVQSTHRLAKKPRLRLADVADEDFVMFFRHVSPSYFDSLMANCREAGFAPKIVHEVNSVASQVAFVACGQGMALVPLAMKHLAPGDVTIRAFSDQIEVITLAVAWNQSRENAIAKEAFMLSARH